ncbi:DUF3419 family protein [Vineibacter terrae]|nr:DUF3419 family protein [Vineibacter terrae]
MSVDSQRGGELLKRAVHRNGALSRDGMLEHLFTWAFKGLVYPQIWEDPEVDLEALAIGSDCHVVAIASGGCNILSYLTADPGRITAVDLNRAHVALSRLKLVAAQHLPSWPAFYRFFGEADDKANVAAYWRFLAPRLDAASRAYWEGRGLLGLGRRRVTLFARNFYRHGLLGHFLSAGYWAARLYGVDLRQALRARTLAEQRRFFDSALAPLFDKKLVRWATSSRMSLYGLGIPPAQYDTLAAAADGHVATVLRARVERLACGFSLADNYFAWQAFGRAYADDADGPLPPYLRRDHFEAVRTRADRVEVLHRSLTDYLESRPARSIDRYVLLDAQDWMTDDQLNTLWQQITRTARPGARVIFRTAAAPSLLPGRVAPDTLACWHYDDATSQALTARDRSAIYGGFHLYIRQG